MSNREAELVWLTEERVHGWLLGSMGAFFSMVHYIKDGIEYDVWVENDEFILMEDLNEYDSDD